MKGIIFTEFMELVEEKFGLDVLDQVLDLSNDEGVYTLLVVTITKIWLS